MSRPNAGKEVIEVRCDKTRRLLQRCFWATGDKGHGEHGEREKLRSHGYDEERDLAVRVVLRVRVGKSESQSVEERITTKDATTDSL